jgi:hypothetical protein
MPITTFLEGDGPHFDPETKRVMGLAFKRTCAALRLRDDTEPVAEIVARNIIELCKGWRAQSQFFVRTRTKGISRTAPVGSGRAVISQRIS